MKEFLERLKIGFWISMIACPLVLFYEQLNHIYELVSDIQDDVANLMEKDCYNESKNNGNSKDED